MSASNQWSDKVAMNALQNRFSGNKVSQLLFNLPVTATYPEVRIEILKGFGLTVYD